MQLSCRELVELRSGPYRARIAPEAGARVASLAWCGAGRELDLLVPWDGAPFDEHGWPKAGAFPMLPFANRLPARGFRFGERDVRPEAAPNGLVQHGVAHRRPWRLVAVSPDRATLRFDADATAGWPWAWSADLVMSLGTSGLTVRMSVRNRSREAMPLGMGWHPYHATPPGLLAHDLSFDAAARHELDAEGKAARADAAPAFGMQPGETAAFSVWAGYARLRSAGGRIAVSCAGARHLVLHRPAGADYLCIEPVTVLPGRLGEDAAWRGPGVLGPGQARQLSWTCGFAAG